MDNIQQKQIAHLKHAIDCLIFARMEIDAAYNLIDNSDHVLLADGECGAIEKCIEALNETIDCVGGDWTHILAALGEL